MNSTELYTRITDQILSLMETHGTDWSRPWTSQGGGAHRNIVTGAAYLFDEIVDDHLLVAVKPAGQGNYDEV